MKENVKTVTKKTGCSKNNTEIYKTAPLESRLRQLNDLNIDAINIANAENF